MQQDHDNTFETYDEWINGQLDYLNKNIPKREKSIHKIHMIEKPLFWSGIATLFIMFAVYLLETFHFIHHGHFPFNWHFLVLISGLLLLSAGFRGKYSKIEGYQEDLYNYQIMEPNYKKAKELLASSNITSDFRKRVILTLGKKTLEEKGIIFCPISEAIEKYPELVKKYIGSVVPHTDNFYAALNSSVFSDGSFCYIPKGVRCPVELSTYFRINEGGTGQFERTLLIADEGAYVSYLEGCTAPQRDENQLHAAVVEIIVHDNAEIKYSTVQNWYPGDKEGKGGVYNFVTKRAIAHNNAKISWTQVETGSAVTWKYPSCILKGDNSIGEFYSIAVTNMHQQADTGTKMIHLGNNTKSTIISKGISAGKSQNSYRGLVKVAKNAKNARNFSQCDSLLMGNECGAHTFPYIETKNASAQIEHEATTSKIGEDQLFYCRQRGIDTEKAIALIVNGFSKEVLNKLPMEFAVEAQKLLEISLENSVG